MVKEKKQNYSQVNEPEKRFKDLQQIETISYAAPHQDILQALLGKTVVGEIEKLGESGGNVEVLEIGTGKGLTTGEILKACDRVKIISVDNDAGMIVQAEKNLEQYIQQEKVELRAEGALEFLKSFPADSVLLIASGFTIHNFKSDYRRDVLAEIYRVLESGGKFITADKIMPDDEEMLKQEVKWQNEQFDKILNPIERKKWIDHYVEDMRPDTIMREGELMKTMEEIGFADIKISNRYHLDALLVARKIKSTPTLLCKKRE